MKNIILIIAFTFFTVSLIAAQSNIQDSLKREYSKIHTSKEKHTFAYKIYSGGKISKVKQYEFWCAEMLEQAKALNDPSKIVQAYSAFATTYNRFSLFEKVAQNITKGKSFWNKADIESKIMLMSSESTYYDIIGQRDLAISSYNEVIKLCRTEGDEGGLAAYLHNQAINYYKADSLLLAKKLILEAYEINDHKGYDNKYTNISMLSNIEAGLGNIEKALEYGQLTLDYYVENNDLWGICLTKINMAGQYLDINRPKIATEYLDDALKIAQENGYKEWELNALGTYISKFEKDKNYEKAYEKLLQHTKLKNEILNESSINQLAKIQKEVDDQNILLLEQEKTSDKLVIDSQNAENAKQSMLLYLAGAFGVLMLVVIFIVWRGYQQKKKSNIEITKQKQLLEDKNVLIFEQHKNLEEKNSEILDSINYAKRIQAAILPPKKAFPEHFSDSFVYYKPKDIVAGDFYWLEVVKKENQEKCILLAAADCTGHGVPGAMVSVVCNNGLNRSVREYGLTLPGEILNQTRSLIIQEFEKSEEEVKDGMDIAFCSIEGTTLKYAGANNPLWLIRDGELLETKAEKQPIGNYYNPTPFITHTVELQKDDAVYIFTDGFADQFGGDRGKKFKAKAFKELLLSIQNLPMQQQHEVIDQTFVDWKGDLEQLDDVCVIGFKAN